MNNSSSSSQSAKDSIDTVAADRLGRSIDRQQPQTLLPASEENYISLAETLPVGIFRTDASGKGIYHNNHWYQIAGVSPEAARGKGWIQSLHPEDRDLVSTQWQKAIQEHRPFELEYRFQRPDGTVTWVYGQAKAELDAQGQIIGYAGTLTDISTAKRNEAIRKQAEIQLELQNALLAKVANNLPLIDILNATIAAVEKILDGAICSVLLLDSDNRLRLGAAPSLDPAFNHQIVEGIEIGEGCGSCGTAAFRNQTIIVTNIATDPLWQYCQEFPLRYGLQACWSSPISSSKNQVLGTFGVYYKQTRSPQPDELKLIAQMANIVGIAIERQQAEYQLQTLIEGTAATTGKDYFPALASNIAKALNVSYALVTEKVEDQLSVLAFWANDSLQSTFAYPIADTPCQTALHQGQYYCESLVQEKFPADLDLVKMRAESYLGIALQDAQGKAIGNLCILDQNRIEDPQKAENLLRVFAARAAAELQRERADQALAQLNQELEQRIWERTAALQKSEQRYRALMDGASDAIFLSDLQGYGIKANHQAEKLLGYSCSELASLHLTQIHPPEVLPAVTKHVGSILNGDGGVLETLVLRRDGRQVPVEITASIIDLDDERIVQAIFRDITERKQAELALELEVLRRNAIFNASSDGIHLLDRDGNLIEANDRFAQMLGYQPAEIVGFTVFDWDAQWSPAELAEVIKNDLLDETTFETLHRRKDGSIFPVEISRRAMVWQGKSFLVNISRDISERQAALHERQQAAAALKASETELRSLFMGMDDLVFVVDRVGTYLKVAPTNPAKLMAPASSIPGKNIQDFFAPEQAAQFLGTIEQTLTTQQTQSYEYRLTIDKIEYWFNAKCSPLDDRSVIWVARDITAAKHEEIIRKQAEELICQQAERAKQAEVKLTETNHQLAVSNQELIRATRLKDEFLANMSHELRTPLNAILGLCESFLEEVFGSINDRQKKAISTVERSGEHLLSLINDILEVSKIEAGKLELEITTVSATTLTNSTLAFVKQLAHQKQIQLTTAFSPNLGNIDVDERRIRQVLINLLNNAVKFTPAGGRVTLAVQLEQAQFCALPTSPDLRQQFDSGAWILFAVTDTGIGITPENQSKLFKPFVQIDGSLNRHYQGTGLGLTLVKQIVELHGGLVTLTSEFGQGSCFTVRLPYHAAVEQQIVTSPEPTPSLSITDEYLPSIAYPLILLAEDNQDNIDTLSSYLEACNYRLIVASNGHEAISILESRLNTPATLPDLILMDIQMPGIDGLETIQRIRQDLQLADLPIIALTALAMTGDREKCLAAGANDYLTKPIKLKQLRENIQRLIPLN